MIQSGTFWLVLLVSAGLFWALPKQVRFGFLATVSFGYLAALQPLSTLALAVWSVAFYCLAPRAARGGPWHRWIPSALILAILTYLACFKYIPPLVAAFAPNHLERHFIIPLGISYFTFKLIHYAVEAARGNIRDRSLQEFFCYMFLLPIFSAGPIERFDHFLSNQDDRWRLESTIEGLTRIAHGLIKKFCIAEMFLVPLMRGVTAEDLLPRLSVLPTYKLWGFFVLTYLYYYMDFSGYSDIAIGASRLFGIRIMENFNFPILARNLGEFWKRWHMTLANWCWTYVYLPVLGRWRNLYAPVFATFLAIGLWHAGSLGWVCWGLYEAAGFSVYVAWSRIKRRHKWGWANHPLWKLLSIAATFLFATSAGVFIMGGPVKASDSLRILSRLFFLDLRL